MAKCPLLLVADRDNTECIKQECDWYNKDTKSCAVNTLHNIRFMLGNKKS